MRRDIEMGGGCPMGMGGWVEGPAGRLETAATNLASDRDGHATVGSAGRLETAATMGGTAATN